MARCKNPPFIGWWPAALLVAGLAGTHCDGSSAGGKPATPPGSTGTPLACVPEDLSPEALRKAGLDPSGNSAVLANGRAITPAGTRFATGEFPLGLVVNADGTRAYVTHNDDYGRALMVLDLTAAAPGIGPASAPPEALLQTIPLGSTFRGVVLALGGTVLAVSGGSAGVVWFFDVNPDGTLAQPGTSVGVSGYVADLAVSADGATVHAVATTNSKVFVIDAATRTLTGTFAAGGAYPYDIEISRDGATLWSSNTAANTVTAIDIASGAIAARIPVGKGPQAMALSPDGARLYVACSDDDRVDVIDTTTRTLADTFDLTGDPDGLRHGNVNGLTLSPDGTRLYVTAAGMNRVDVVDTATGGTVGAIPTGWYPTEVRADAKALYVASSKGMGNPNPRQLKTIPGFLAAISWPDAATLETWTAQVTANNRRSSAYFTGDCRPEMVPVLSGPDTSPIKHVVLIVRENKTYDMVLGDLKDAQGTPIGDGDPALVVFGEKYTPNFHKLSREFTTLDNYYANAEVSLQGHEWTTQSHCNDFMEKTHLDQLPIPGLDPSLESGGETPMIFDLCFANGVSFRNYGEFPSFGLDMLDKYRDFYDHKYPFWTQGVWDVDKAAEVIREWELDIFPSFIFIGLPNDHTYGTKVGFPTPQTMVADNDRGTAMLIEWLSNSVHWPDTAVFIIEDDPQGSGDHVEAHRSLCTIVSPWARRNHISSVHYDIPSIFRTIEMILGLPAMGKNDAYAPAMTDVWVDGEAVAPDYTPYESVVVDVPNAINGVDAVMAAESALCGDEVDGCEGLGRILWRVMKGDVEPPPYARGIDR
jgi:YVTN family beta-propeller protein